MKRKLYFVALCMFAGAWSFAQKSNAILFTENGEKFTVILNGLRQNDKPETNVKIQGLNTNFYKMKVIFAETALGEKNFNLGIETGTETSYVIKKNNKGEYVVRMVSSTSIAEAPVTKPDQTVVIYQEAPAPAPDNYSTGQSQTTQTTTTTTTGTGTTGTGVSVGVNMNENGGSINMNVQGMEDPMVTGGTVQTTTTTTTTHSHTTGGNAVVHDTPPPSYLPGYNGPVGCPVPMSPGDFTDLKSSIDSKSFEDSKMTILKQVVGSNCILASQAKDLMLLFTFEQSRLDVAKYCYKHTYDIGNYYKVNDAFTFESSIDDLNKYINANK